MEQSTAYGPRLDPLVVGLTSVGLWALPLALTLVEAALQLLSPLCSASLSDLMCDLLGVLCFWGLSRWGLARPGRSKPVSGFHPLNG